MPLTDTFAKNIKHIGAVAGDKHTDGGGMYRLVNAGGKYWRMNYRFADKCKTLALGVHPAVSFAKAGSGAKRHANCWPTGSTGDVAGYRGELEGAPVRRRGLLHAPGSCWPGAQQSPLRSSRHPFARYR